MVDPVPEIEPAVGAEVSLNGPTVPVPEDALELLDPLESRVRLTGVESFLTSH